MTDTFIYKCPNCGGKVDYIDNKWHCSYCNGVYDALFAMKEDKILPNYKNVTFKLFSYKCAKCNSKFVSELPANATCQQCNEISNVEGTPFIISNIMDVSYDRISALNEFQKEIENYNNSDSFFCEEPQLQYINCDLYNGFVKLSYNNHVMKYIFVNLLVPNIDYEDYRFMYEVGNNGFRRSDFPTTDNQNEIKVKIIKNANYLNSINDKNYENDLLNKCINDFMKKCGINDVNSIEIKKNFKVDDGFYIPFYVSNSKDNQYHHYVFGNSNMSVIKKDIFNRVDYSKAIIELPEEKDAHQKMRRFDFLQKFFRKITFAFLILLFISFTNLRGLLLQVFGQFGSSHSDLFFTIIAIIAIILIIMFASYYYFYRKYNYYEKTIKLTKDEYLDQIINNSNCVKVIKVKK